MTAIIPYQLLQGLHSVTDALLSKLPPFYAQVVCSYAHTNNLYYKAFDSNTLPQNLWCGAIFSHIDNDWISAGFYTVVDLPIQAGKIDVIAVTQQLHEFGYNRSPYLYCCAFQSCFAQFFAQPIEGTFIPNDLLPVSMKQILQAEVTCLLSLDNWCRVLQIVPLEVPEA